MADTNATASTDRTPCNEPVPEPSEKECRYCFEPINFKANVCHHCSRAQNSVRRYLEGFGPVASMIGLLISIIFVVLAFLELGEARKERVKASAALATALEAKTNIKEQGLILTRMMWLWAETSLEIGTERQRKAVKLFLEDATLLWKKAIPDEKKRAAWRDEMYQLLPKKK